MAVAKRRAIEHPPRTSRSSKKHEEFAQDNGRSAARGSRLPSIPTTISATICCASCSSHATPCSQRTHASRSPCGSSADSRQRRSRALFSPEATIAQRIVRAKRTLAEARVPFEVRRARAPAAPRLGARSHLSRFQRRLLGNRRRRRAAPRALRRSASARARARRTTTVRTEVHGLAALLEIQASRLERASMTNGRTRCCCWTRTAAAGITSSSRGVSPRSSVPNGCRRGRRWNVRPPSFNRRMSRARSI